MKFIIEKKELSALTTIVYRAASNKNTIPVLSGLFINVNHNEGLALTATDMEIGIKASTSNIEIIEEGTALVNAHYFADFIKLLPDSPVALELNEEKSKLNISYGRSSGFINTYREHEYPDLPINNIKNIISLPQDILKKALRKTAFAAAVTHFRQVFTGVLFDIIDNKTLRIIASDTHRLAYYTYNISEADLEPINFIIPVRTVNELLRLLDDNKENINIGLNKNSVVFYKDNFLIVSRLIDGQYPNYDQVIPDSFNTSVKINSHILLNTLERAKIMPTDEKLKIQHIQFKFKDNEAVVNTYSELMGEIEEVIEEIKLDGDGDLKISFNTSYLLDAIKIFESECDQITIDLSGSLGPAMLKNINEDNYFYIIVPLRTSS